MNQKKKLVFYNFKGNFASQEEKCYKHNLV